MKQLVLLMAVTLAAFAADETPPVAVQHFDASFCARFAQMGIPTVCQEGVFVIIPASVQGDSFRVVVRFRRDGGESVRVGFADAASGGFPTTIMFPLKGIELISVSVEPLSRSSDSITIMAR